MSFSDFYEGREQSAAKHQILERYLKAFTPIVGSSFDEIVYIDCFAGPWNSKSPDLSDTSFGRAIAVFRDVKLHARCKRVRCLLVENKLDSFQRLQQYAANIRDIEVDPKLWDFEHSVPKIVDYVKSTPSRKVFPFVFIDPWGYELVALDLIRPLLRLTPGEVLITFMSSFVNRFLPDSSKPFERLLGASEVERLRRLSGEILEDELVASYARNVRDAGAFKFSCAVPVLEPNRDRFLFHMVFATRTMHGLEEFKKAEKNMVTVMHTLRAEAQRRRQSESGSGFLFPAMHTYKEERFSRFRENSLRAANAALRSMLQRSRSLFFQDLLNVGLQYSAVLEEDIGDFVGAWFDEGLVNVEGLSRRQRTLHRETRIIWQTPKGTSEQP